MLIKERTKIFFFCVVVELTLGNVPNLKYAVGVARFKAEKKIFCAFAQNCKYHLHSRG